MNDPMKDLVRQYDAAVVAKGGTSLFSFKAAMVRMVPDGTYAEPRHRIAALNPKRWFGEELERLRVAYEGTEKIETIAEEFVTSPGRVSRLATLNGWKMRRLGPNRSRPTAQVGGFAVNAEGPL